jgi:hypothetical protein
MEENLEQKLDLKQKSWKEKKQGFIQKLKSSIENIKQQCSQMEHLVEELSKADNEKVELEKIKSIDEDISFIKTPYVKKLSDIVTDIENELNAIKTIREDIESAEDFRTAFDFNNLEREVISSLIRRVNLRVGRQL